MTKATIDREVESERRKIQKALLYSKVASFKGGRWTRWMDLSWLSTKWRSDNDQWRVRVGDWGDGRLLVGWKSERSSLFIPVWEGVIEKLPPVTVLAKEWNRAERMLKDWESHRCSGSVISAGEVDRALVRAASWWLIKGLLPKEMVGRLLRELVIESPLRLMGLTVMEALAKVQSYYLTERQVVDERKRFEVWLALARAWMEEWPPVRGASDEWEGYE